MATLQVQKNNTWRMSVHISQNLLLISEIIKSLELPKYYLASPRAYL
jgi:hypothetical protein